jgi:hypothetical protein
MTAQKIWVDPPSGWKYGFPKVYDPASDGDIMEWIVRCGYPEPLVKDYGDHFYTRQWYAEAPE